MKKIILTIIALTLLQTSQAQMETRATQTLVKQIDSKVNVLKANISRYTKIVKQNDDAGNGYEYRRGSELKIITIEGKDPRDGMNKKVDWYFNKGEEIYAETKWTNASGKTMVFQQVYVNNGQLMALYDLGKQVEANSQVFKQMAPQVTLYAAALNDHTAKEK